MSNSSEQPVLQVAGLKKTFFTGRSVGGRRAIHAVDDVSFDVGHAETVGVVGESGSGKTTLARLVMRLHRPDQGTIRLLGQDVHDLSNREFRRLRKHVQMVFQNPQRSLDPLRPVGRSIADVMRLDESLRDRKAQRVKEVLDDVGLSPSYASRKPSMMSGGQLQRVAIARAIATHPELLVLDEPTSALDMSIQGQILRLLRDLQEKLHLSYLLISHDLPMIRLVARRVIVVYLGQIVEEASSEVLFNAPQHPYTVALLQAGIPDGKHNARLEAPPIRLQGTVSYPDPDYDGCRLVDRCPFAVKSCRQKQELQEVSPGHLVRCRRSVDGLIL